MYNLKQIFAGTAGSLLAITGAVAADLPVKAPAVEYMRVCSLYGSGFWYIPGTDTCIKIGGFMRIDTTFNGGVYGQPAWSLDLGLRDRYYDYMASRSRLGLTVDTRTATEYGVLRTFAQTDLTFNNFFTADPLVLGAPPGIPGGLNSAVLMGVGGGYLPVDYVFIQFAGFAIGKSSSAYATPWNGYPGNITSYLIGGHDTVTGVNNIQYTAQFGSGVSGSIGLDDPTVFNRTSVLNLSLAGSATAAGANAYAGFHAPDVVGRVRVEQAWGLFQVSAAAHEVNASYNILGAGGAPNNLSEISGHPASKWGGSVMAALQFKNLPTGANDDIKMDASYAAGDTKNVISTSATSPSFAMYSGSGRAYQSFGFGQTADAVYLPVGLAAGGAGIAGPGGTGDIKLVESYGARGAFNHNWDPAWSTSVWGGAAAVRYNGNATDIRNAKGQWCANYIASNKLTAANTSADFSCNPDYNVYMAGVITRWNPVKNMTFAGEVGYFRLDQKMTGAAAFISPAIKPSTVYEYKNQDTAYLNVRVQRNF
jgi:hypothetical protein